MTSSYLKIDKKIIELYKEISNIPMVTDRAEAAVRVAEDVAVCMGIDIESPEFSQAVDFNMAAYTIWYKEQHLRKIKMKKVLKLADQLSRI